VVAAALDAPAEARPLRVAFCTVLPDAMPEPKHDAVGLGWFADRAHLARFDAWLSVADEDELVIAAEENVLRGADWLERRWIDGGDKLKHMAIAQRAEGLGRAEFHDLWRRRAGRVGATPIPEDAKGRAYVQNHPLPRMDGDWAYDAVNEVYFDDLDGLRRRIAWFADALGDTTEQDLVKESWFLAAREEVLS
jgi:hypothetical protein